MKKSIPYIILLSFILFFLYKKGSNDAYQLNSDFNMNAVNLDVAKRTFPLVFNNTEYNSFEYSTLKVKNEIFLVRYRSAVPNGLYFYTKCIELKNKSTDINTSNYIYSISSNKALGYGILIEHAGGEITNTNCVILVDNKISNTGTFIANKVSFGDINFPYIKISFHESKNISIGLLTSSEGNLMSITWE